MNVIFESDLNTISWFRFVICLVSGLIFFYFEYTKKFQLSYSKFNSKGDLDSKKGMFLIYFLPLLTYVYFYLKTPNTDALYYKLIFIAVTLHFAKRCLEVLFLHKYSGKISILTTIFITWAYSSIAYSIHESVNTLTSLDMLESGVNGSLYFGFFLFLLGQISNLYHHILLRKLRSGVVKEYKIPEGGLFPYVNCPHYLSEIIAWIGIAIMTKYLIVFGLTFVMASYLVGRSINTTRWYKEKIPNFPSDRKSIIPFVI